MSHEIAKAYEPKDVEAKWYPIWEASGAFKGRLPNADDPSGGATPSSAAEPFSIVIPPPNVTGVLHMGHILNNTMQDILTRRARQEGKAAVWIPGTDHAGIATQTKVEKELRKEGKTKWDLGREAFYEKVKEWRDEHGGIILKQLRKLGCSCDWERTVHTLDTATDKAHVTPGPDNAGVDYHRAVLTAFVELFRKGMIYRGKRMVNWCPKSLTALSDEEVIPKKQNGFLYKMRYEIAERPGEFIQISTTRPETLMGDIAVAFHPDDERYQHLKGLHAVRPFPKANIPFIADEHVEMEFGTGMLKVTPAHDRADFDIYNRHKAFLDEKFAGEAVIDVLTPDGKIHCPDVPELHGLDRFAARKKAAEMLEETGALVEKEKYENNVGFSERADVPIEPRLSDQWWLKYPKVEEAKDAVASGKIKFYPERWTKTYAHWLDNIQDWCISRQLWWGHRIPVWYRKGIDRAALTEEDLQNPEKVLVCVDGPADPENWEQEEDVLDTWASSWLWPFATLGWPAGEEGQVLIGVTIEEYDRLKKGTKVILLESDKPGCYLCIEFEPSFKDIQFERGESIHIPKEKVDLFHNDELIEGVYRYQKVPPELAFWYPTEVLATGPDIIFFWVARMIMAGLEFMGEVPFKHVVFNGIIRDAQGRKMSKSLGNSPDPLDLIEKFGADGLRLGMLMMAPKGSDIHFSEDRVQLGRNFCNKLWNACRFRQLAVAGNEGAKPPTPLSAATPEATAGNHGEAVKDAAASWVKGLALVDADDHAIIARLMATLEETEAAYRDFEFNKLTEAIYRFFWTDYCDWYVEVSKAKLQSDAHREGCIAILDLCLCSTLQMLAPVTPFICEELWGVMGYNSGDGFIQDAPLLTATKLRKELEAAGIALDAAAISEVDALQEFVAKARALKAQSSLSAKNDVSLYLVGDEAQLAVVDSHKEKLRKLVGFGSLEHTDDLKHMPSELTPLGTLYLDLAGSVDVEAEKKKLHKQLAGLEKAIQGTEARLSNEKFTSSAPATIIQGARDQLADNIAKRDELLKLLEGLG